MRDLFRRFACRTAEAAGHPAAFMLAVGCIAAWLITGPIFHFSDTWQLIINTGTTIITFLMVFLIQNAQNRDTRAIHLKLNELLVAVKDARDELIDVEEMSDEELETLRNEYRELHEHFHTEVLRREERR